MHLLRIHKELRDDYHKSERRKSDQYFLLYPLYRAVSFPVAAVFIYFGLSANQATLIGAAFLVVSLALFIGDVSASIFWGTMFYLMAFLVDFADGSIARFHGRPNAFGKLIDGLVDSLSFLLFIAVAIANVRSGTNLLSGSIELTMAIFATFSALFMQNYEFRVMYLLKESEVSITSSEQDAKNESNVLARLANKSYRNAITATPLLILALVPFDLLSVLLTFWFVVHVCLGLPKLLIGLVLVRRKLGSVYRAT